MNRKGKIRQVVGGGVQGRGPIGEFEEKRPLPKG